MNEQKNRSDLIWKWPTVCFPFVVDSFSVLLFLSPLFFLPLALCSLLSRFRLTEIHLFTVSCAAGLLIIHSRANIPTSFRYEPRPVTQLANRKIQFFSR